MSNINSYHQQYYEDNKEKLSKYNKAYQKEYYRKNKQKFKEYYVNNKEQRTDYQRAYQQKSKLAIRQYQHVYYEKQRKIVQLKKMNAFSQIEELKIEKKSVVVTFD